MKIANYNIIIIYSIYITGTGKSSNHTMGSKWDPTVLTNPICKKKDRNPDHQTSNEVLDNVEDLC